MLDDVKCCESRRTVTIALFVLIMGVAVALRFWNVAAEAPWYDEVCSLRYLDAPDLSTYLEQQRVEEPATIQFYYVLQYLWGRVFGTSTLAIRMLSMLFGLMAIPMLFMLTRRLFSDRAALVASACMAMSMGHINYSQETRGYSLIFFMALASCYCLMRALNGDGRRWWVMHFLANVCFSWSHLLSPLIIVAQGVFLLIFHFKRIKMLAAWTVCHLGLMLSLLWWIGTMHSQRLHVATDIYGAPPLADILSAYLTYVGGRYCNENPAPFLVGSVSLDYLLAIIFGLLTLTACASAFLLRRSRQENKPAPLQAIALPLLWLLLPVFAVVMLSYLWKPCFHHRYLLHCSLPFLILAGAGADAIRSRKLFALVVTAMFALYAYQATALRTTFRPDFKAAAQCIDNNGQPHAPVLVLKFINRLAMEYNSDIAKSRMIELGGEFELFAESIRQREQGNDFFVVMWRWDALEKWEQHLTANHMQFTKRVMGGMPPLHLYHITARIQETSAQNTGKKQSKKSGLTQ